VVGEWIYYSDMFGAEVIFRTKLDGTVEQSMGWSGNYLRFSQGYLYYRHPVSEEFFRINVFTSKREELGPLGPRSVLYFYGDTAYYANATGLHWFSEKGGERDKIN